ENRGIAQLTRHYSVPGPRAIFCSADYAESAGRLLKIIEGSPLFLFLNSALSTCYFLLNLKQTKHMTHAGAYWAGISPLRAAVMWASARIFSINRLLRRRSAGNAESTVAPAATRSITTSQ